MAADTRYSMSSKKMQGFEGCNALNVYRDFVRCKREIAATDKDLTVTYPKRAHNPILRSVLWHRMPESLTMLYGARLKLAFK
jgi:hypothetical protein